MKRALMILFALIAVGLLALGVNQLVSDPRSASPNLAAESRGQAVKMIETLAVRFNAAIENGRDTTPILDQTTALLAQYDDIVDGHILAGQAYAYREDMERAYEHFAQAIEGRPDDPQLQNIAGSTAEMAGRLDAAEQHHQRAVELANANPQILFSMAVIHLKRERFGRAIELLDQAIANRYVFPNARMALADAFQNRAEQGDLLKAIEQLELALVQLPVTDESQPTRIVFARKLARLFAATGDVAEATRILNSLSPASRFSEGVSQDLASYYQQLDQPGLAALHYDGALRFNPDHADYAATAADWYIRSGDLPAARTMLRHLRNIDPDHAALTPLRKRIHQQSSPGP